MGREQHIALIGGVKREGAWVADRDILVVTLVGGAEVDLSQATIPASGLTIAKYSLVGGVDVVVPPGVNVELSGFSLFGGRDIGRRADGDPNLPAVRITSYGVFGGISVREA